MRIGKIVRVIPLIPFAYGSILFAKHKSFEYRFQVLKKWSERIMKWMGYKLEVEGVENIPLDEPLIFVCNHQGTLDPALICASSPVPLSFVSKKENEKIPLLGRAAKLIETIHFDRNSRKENIYMLREAMRYIKKGRNILIFPEGTRSKGDVMNSFYAGAFQTAFSTKATIQPVTLNHSYCMDVKENISTLRITYGESVSFEEYSSLTLDECSLYFHQVIESEIKA